MRMFPANYEFVFCDTMGNGVRNDIDDEELAARSRMANDMYTEDVRQIFRVIEQHQVEKPRWFREQEKSARQFVQSLGLVAAKNAQITLMDEPPQEYTEKLLPNEADGEFYTQAFYSRYYGVVYRNDYATLQKEQGVEDGVAIVLSHELTHAAEYKYPHSYERYNYRNEAWESFSRTGLTTYKDSESRGAFFSEGIAEYVAGLYVRRQEDPRCGLVSIGDEPSETLPSHYRAQRPDTEAPIHAGPEAYSLEVLAWGAERKGVLPRDEFIRAALAACSIDASVRLDGLRTFTRSLQAIQPGLYADLRELSHAPSSWQQGLDMTLDAVQNIDKI